MFYNFLRLTSSGSQSTATTLANFFVIQYLSRIARNSTRTVLLHDDSLVNAKLSVTLFFSVSTCYINCASGNPVLNERAIK